MIGSPHLTVGCAPKLDACIKKTEPGQASWAGWKAPRGKTCGQCRHFEKERGKRLLHELQGRCAKYHSLMRKPGPKLSARCAACSFFVEDMRPI